MTALARVTDILPVCSERKHERLKRDVNRQMVDSQKSEKQLEKEKKDRHDTIAKNTDKLFKQVEKEITAKNKGIDRQS